jgi:hypothetical protein
VLGPPDEAPTESALNARVEIEVAGIADSTSKPEMGEEKLSKAYNETCKV